MRRSPTIERWSWLALATVALCAAGAVSPAEAGPGSALGPRSPGAGGSELWEARYDGPAGRSDSPTDMAVDAAGTRVFVTGWSFDPTNYLQYVTVAYAAGTGRKLWVSRLDVYYGEATGVAVSPDGTRVFVTGAVSYGTGNSDWGTVAYDASTGAQLWYVRYDRAGVSDLAMDVEVSPDGTHVFVTGSAADHAPSDYATIAYDAATGDELWTAFYDGPLGDDDEAVALEVAPDGSGLYVTGHSCGVGTGQDYATVGYDTLDGAQLWVARYSGPRPGSCPFEIGDRPAALAVSPDGSALFVTGESPGQYPDGDVTTLGYDATTGTQRWVRRYRVPNPDTFTGGVDVGVSPNSKTVFVAGTIPTNQSDFVTIAYSSARGKQLWATTYDGPGNGGDVAQALAVGPLGAQVSVTGRSYGGTSDDYATLAYDASTGAQRWVARYNGPGNGFDLPYAIAVRPKGDTIYVTGNSLGNTSDDYLTVAYLTG